MRQDCGRRVGGASVLQIAPGRNALAGHFAPVAIAAQEYAAAVRRGRPYDQVLTATGEGAVGVDAHTISAKCCCADLVPRPFQRSADGEGGLGGHGRVLSLRRRRGWGRMRSGAEHIIEKQGKRNIRGGWEYVYHTGMLGVEFRMCLLLILSVDCS